MDVVVSAGAGASSNAAPRLPTSTATNTLLAKNELCLDDDVEEPEPMEIPTTVTIIEEDGTQSIVEGATVSSVQTIVPDIAPSSSSIRLSPTGSDSVTTYQVVGIQNDGNYQAPVQILNSSSLNDHYYVLNHTEKMGRPVARSQIIDSRAFNRYGIVKSNHTRDDKKRATHNEVERRRRDKINAWIGKLAKIVPTCVEETASKSQSKGGILAKACEYIGELKSTNCRLAATLKQHENTAQELDTLRREVNELRKENLMLKQQLCPIEVANGANQEVVITTTLEVKQEDTDE